MQFDTENYNLFKTRLLISNKYYFSMLVYAISLYLPCICDNINNTDVDKNSLIALRALAEWRFKSDPTWVISVFCCGRRKNGSLINVCI